MVRLILITLLLCCVVATGLTMARLRYDVHYRRVYVWSVDNFTAHAYPEAILLEVQKAEWWGRWRPEMPYFEARAWIECDLQGFWREDAKLRAMDAMNRAAWLAPHAWWVKQLIGNEWR